MSAPRRWTLAELTRDSKRARDIFRKERLEEPLELYGHFFETFAPVFERLIASLPEMASHEMSSETLASLVSDSDARTAFRYLAAPPISEDDLKTLAESTLSASALRNDPDQSRRICDTVLHILDPHRFPWVRRRQDPDPHEKERAIVASAALVAAKKVETKRRIDPSKTQETAVKELLSGLGFEEVPRREIALPDAAPKPGCFCGESKFGDTRADIVVRLHDRRIMPVECKVSNSEVNSFKRVNHEAAGKARTWLKSFGHRATVPAAVLTGVFKAGNLETAQAEGLSLFWSHRLKDLADFVERTLG